MLFIRPTIHKISRASRDETQSPEGRRQVVRRRNSGRRNSAHNSQRNRAHLRRSTGLLSRVQISRTHRGTGPAVAGAALEAAPETPLSTAISQLSDAGAPIADAEAIVAGISAFKDKLRRHAIPTSARSGLNAYSGWHKGRVGERPPPVSSTRRPILAALATLCCVVLGVSGYLLYQAKIPLQATALWQQRTAASESRISNSHQPSSSPHNSPGRHHERELARKPRHQSISRTGSSSMATGSPPESVAKYSATLQPPARRSACPPGDDRIGCAISVTQSTFLSTTKVPVNAHYEPNGYGWQCNPGYVERGQTCIKLIVPPHAHLDISGHGWFCDAGFEPRGETCQSY